MTEIPPPLVDVVRGRYRLEGELGGGGMATVYPAWDLRHDRPVALEVLHPGLSQALGAKRFLREIRLCARLQHPYVLTVQDSGEAGGRSGSPCPLSKGRCCARLQSERQRLPFDVALFGAGVPSRTIRRLRANWRRWVCGFTYYGAPSTRIPRASVRFTGHRSAICSSRWRCSSVSGPVNSTSRSSRVMTPSEGGSRRSPS